MSDNVRAPCHWHTCADVYLTHCFENHICRKLDMCKMQPVTVRQCTSFFSGAVVYLPPCRHGKTVTPSVGQYKVTQNTRTWGGVTSRSMRSLVATSNVEYPDTDEYILQPGDVPGRQSSAIVTALRPAKSSHDICMHKFISYRCRLMCSQLTYFPAGFWRSVTRG